MAATAKKTAKTAKSAKTVKKAKADKPVILPEGYKPTELSLIHI